MVRLNLALIPPILSLSSFQVYDIWQQAVVANTKGSYTASVPSHGTAFLRLSVSQEQ